MNWVSYWRSNPQRFVEDYLGIRLYLFQKILFFMIERVDLFMFIAARGLGKSFLIAIYCVVRCILYPGTRIVVASGTRGQANKVISEKIVALYRNYAGVRREIGNVKNIRTGLNETSVTFMNGSVISAETSSDNSRGLRCNILIVDEFRMVKKDVLDKVLKPMLNVYRQPPFLTRPEYRNYPREENKQIYMSSAWFKSHWSWESFRDFLNGMLKGKSQFVIDFPYQLSILHQLLSRKAVEQERSQDSFEQNGFDMEYEALFIGENDNSYFKLDAINQIRTVPKTFIPPTKEEYIANVNKTHPKNLSNIPRIDKKSEIRIVALDIALMGGNPNVKNDTSAFTCMRLVQDGETYRRDVLYLESIQKNIVTNDLAIRLKQLYQDFEADYVVMDANGNGLGVFDACCRVLYDDERDVEYPAWASINDEVANDRTKSKGIKVIFSVKATAQFNHEIATSLKSVIDNKKLRLPINDISRREELVDEGKFLSLNLIEQQRKLYAYQQASALATELVNLEYIVRQGMISIREVGTATKDRYSSLAYCNYYANELEKQLKQEQKVNFLDYLMINGNRGF